MKSEYPDKYLDQYKIEGAVNLDDDPCFFDRNIYPNFQLELDIFKSLLLGMVSHGDSKTFYKFGDGDYHFLKKYPIGSAQPGRRALSKLYSKINHEEFVEGVELNDFYTCELYPNNREHFKQAINKNIDYPAEFGYGLTANRWLTKTFSGSIGLIGAEPKLRLIQELLKHNEYQEYLGLEKFEDYIYIPQKFACDNINNIEDTVARQLDKSTSKIFLLGIGHVKSALLHRLKKYKNAIYLDVGSGIDALAGVIDPGRPYFGGWINYQIENYDYKDIDLLRYNWDGNIRKVRK